MSSDNCYSITASRNAREFEERRNKERKLHILCLIEQYLRDEGYLDTAKCLMNEVPISKNYIICDNIDLNTILQEYESYYYLRFQKYPKICKKLAQIEKNNVTNGSQRTKMTTRPPSSTVLNVDSFSKVQTINNLSKDNLSHHSSLTVLKNSNKCLKSFENSGMLDLGLIGLPLGSSSKNSSITAAESEKTGTMLKPMSLLDDISQDWKEMAREISKDIIVENPDVHWNDIIGHEDAKKILKEAILYPLMYPELFTGILGPWKGLLLYGPPGTGKSLLAKAVATEFNTTFISISPSTITSKWRGDSEKLIKVVFDLACKNAPSTILMEEVDALVSRRDSQMEHEASRRMKTELLVQMDKLVHHHNSMHEERVFLLATSNIPWEIDAAMLRRIEKRVLVDLPTFKERQQLFEYFLPPNMKEKWNGPSLSCHVDYSDLAKVSEGYSGSDIKLVCKESLMERMRDAFLILESSDQGQNTSSLQLQKLTNEDVKAALLKTKPTAAKLSIKYNQWKDEFGSS